MIMVIKGGLFMSTSLLSNYLENKSGGILKIQPEISDLLGQYSMYDSGGTELCVSEYLWALVRLLKPEHILETGCYTGVSSLYMAQALKDNGFGNLLTLEIENTHKLRAENLWNSCGVSDYVKCILTPSLEYYELSNKQYDLIFLDSEPGIRFAELVRFFPYLKEGGYVGIHDLPNSLCQGNVNPDHPEMKSYPYGDLPEQIKEWLKTDKLRMIHFPSPRGLTFFYKPKENDYRP